MRARPREGKKAYNLPIADERMFHATDWPIQHFYMIERQHMLNSTRLLRQHGIDHMQWRVLVSLIEHDGLWINDMAARCGIERTTLSKLLDRIEAKGLVLRVIEPQDRRRFRIVLTPKGRSTYRKCVPLVLRLFDNYFEEFSPEEMHELLRMLRCIRKNVEMRGLMMEKMFEL